MDATLEARAIFKAIDVNGDGKLEPHELSAGLADFGALAPLLAQERCPDGCPVLLPAPDTPAAQCAHRPAGARAGLEDEAIEGLFPLLDTDGDGSVDLSEWVAGFSKCALARAKHGCIFQAFNHAHDSCAMPRRCRPRTCQWRRRGSGRRGQGG